MGLPPAGKHPVHFLFDLGKKDGTPARGLFVLWRAVNVDGPPDDDPSSFKLGFCAHDGVLFDTSALNNPWQLALRRGSGVGSRLGASAEQWSPQPYELVFVAHPSADFARELLRRLQNRQDPAGRATPNFRSAWPVQLITPDTVKRNLVVKVPQSPAAFIPRGPQAYGGWLLYRHMPYQPVADVMSQVKRLVFQLSRLRYAAACFAPIARRHVPYVTNETEHSGVFDGAVHAALHRFQRDLAAGTAFALAPEARSRGQTASSELQSWSFLIGSAQSVTPVSTDPGTVDAPTANALQDWFTRGLRKPGIVLVERNTLWGRPELWWSLEALNFMCREFGATYQLRPGNTFRILPSSGAGQVERSLHKIGAALDLDSFAGDPSDSMPVGYEGNWTSHSSLEWIVYIHSSKDIAVDAPPISITTTPLRELTAFMTERLGPTLPTEASDYLSRLEQQIVALQAMPPAQIVQDFFRSTIRRFQFQSGESDAGNAQRDVTASKDAERNPAARAARSWFNVSRQAFRLGLQTIGAHEDKLDVPDSKLGKTQTLKPGVRSRTQKALILDDLAERIRRAAAAGLGPITVTTPGGKSFNIAPADINLEAISSWVPRTTDHADVLAPLAAGMTLSNDGVDLTIEVPFTGDRSLLNRFLNQRASIPIRVERLGDGLMLPAPAVSIRSVGDLQQAISQATVVPGQRDLTLTVRPNWNEDLTSEGDPGAFSYQVPLLSSPLELEWWHFELQPSRAGLFWHDFADDIGLDAAVLEAPAEPDVNSSGPLWVGGLGLRRARTPFSVFREPQNQVRNFERPT